MEYHRQFVRAQFSKPHRLLRLPKRSDSDTLDPMKIALAIEHLDHRRGGAETYVHDFASWLLAQGHAVQIVTQSAHAPPEGAEVHLVAAGGPEAFAEAVGRELSRLAPDVSLATGKALGMTVYQPHGGTVRGSQRQNAALRRSDAARAVKLLFNRLSPKHRAARRLEALQFADPRTHFVAISRMVMADMRSFYGLGAERITLVYNGVDVDRFNPERVRAQRDEVRRRLGVADRATLLLATAHNFKLKGIGELIAALERLTGRTEADVRLVVVGRGREGPYRRQVRRLGLGDRVIFAGGAEDMAPFYGAADAFVHPTWYDPCSLVVLEAMAAGLPTLTTRFNGAAELLEGRGAGLVLDAPRPVARLAEGLAALLDADRRAEMSRAARAVAEEHSAERNFCEMLEVLTRAAERI